MEIQKRSRRNNDQMLADALAELYKRIQIKVQAMDDHKAELEEIFEALAPLKSLEDEFRGK